MEAVAEMPNPMSQRSSYFPWEQEGVFYLQQALNSQSSVISQQSSLQPVSYATLWDPSQAAELESQETLDVWYRGYGEISAFNPKGVDQQKLYSEGNAYIKRDFPMVDFIQSCERVRRVHPNENEEL